MASRTADRNAQVPADHTAAEILATPEPAQLAEPTATKTRAPSKTRHLSAVRAQKVENVIMLMTLSKTSTDSATKGAAVTLAFSALDEVISLDNQIAKIQSQS